MRFKMTIGAAGFQYVSTTTDGKLDIIEWQKRRVRGAYGDLKFTGKGLSLPGHHSQLKRHIQELLDYGVAEDNQIMVDWTYTMYANLVTEANRIGFKGKVVYGNLIDVVRNLWKNGEQIDVIDFDHIGYLESEHLQLLEEACDNDVKVFIGVFATRGNRGGFNWFQQDIINKYNIKPYFHRRGNLTYSLREIQGAAIYFAAQKKKYKCDYEGYQGLSTMVSCVVTK